MALTQEARGKIKSFVQAAKKLLMNEFESQLQQFYGIRPDGTCLLVEELTAREASVIETSRLLRQRLHYLEESIAGHNKAPEAVRQLIREQAFTILNRFSAIRMSEERNIIRESIRNGYNSEGFQVYDQLTGSARTAEQFIRYKWYIGHVFDELAIDLPAVFDRFSPYALLFPSERVMLDLLAIINDEDINIYRETGYQPLNLWTEDETIGWIYQYYNSKEEIKDMRKASDAPRNSRELAVRNQFFTPRYVVQFLVDNSLGRQWYEMTKGKTALVDLCQYIVKQKKEIFLEKGEVIPEAKLEDAHYIEFRALKDPRKILMLDPACGSMHFGLYSFDLFELIYLEAWDNHPELLRDLREQYLREEFIKQIPGYILRYNIHGVDIDPRAIQIAGLSLWLRAQKSFDKLSIQPTDRPAINKSNLVISEPMPGDKLLLSEFTKNLPGPIGNLVRVIWEKMQLAGETGLLLKIEEELKKEIEIAKQEYKEYKNISSQSTLFDLPAQSKAAQMEAIYGKGQKITKDFFDTAEEEVLKALKNFAENADGEDAFQKLLFAEDTARGFAFIELCRKRYDIIVMNPPFGSGSIGISNYLQSNYINWGKNILCCFFDRMNELTIHSGQIGSIYDRTVQVRTTYKMFRETNMIGRISVLCDLGWGVLDANVETSCCVLNTSLREEKQGWFLDLREDENKKDLLLREINSKGIALAKYVNSSTFKKLPDKVIGYYFDEQEITLFQRFKSLDSNNIGAKTGNSLNPINHYRQFWEIPKYSKKRIRMLYNGGDFSMFYMPNRQYCYYDPESPEFSQNKNVTLRNVTLQEVFGVGYGERGEILDAHILKDKSVFTNEGKGFPIKNEETSIQLLSFLNSIFVQRLMNLYGSIHHKTSGAVSLLPWKPVIKNEVVKTNIEQILNLKWKWLGYDQTTVEFNGFVSRFFNIDDIDSCVKKLEINYKEDSLKYRDLVYQNDEYWLSHFNISQKLRSIYLDYRRLRPSDELISIDSLVKDSEINLVNFCQELLMDIINSIFKGGCFYKNNNNNIFEEIEYDNQSKRLIDDLTITNDGILSSVDLNKLIKQFIEVHFEFSGNIFYNLEKNLGLNSIDEFTFKSGGYFDYHLKRYTKNRRVAPIHWLLGVPSGKFAIWLYYPTVNHNTLFKIVNEQVDPLITDVGEKVKVLIGNGSVKELNDQKELLAELYDFKEELLRVAQLPYKPNQDDGVLITAAPLHNLFRHAKWKKDTKDCWKKLEKGEYDWAHLAYSIWPERVHKKCKKDLSMAIGHGIEDICEVKPKEKKDKGSKEIKASSQLKLD